jgi:hypothetical protein
VCRVSLIGYILISPLVSTNNNRRFGFPNREALAEGRSGMDCRGEEHDVVIIWSVTSGKRQVLMDGKEIHYSATRTGVIDHSWSSKGNHVIKVVAHAAPPLSASPGFRQYDLFIDGQSFFNMPKVYELGVRGSSDRMPGRKDYAEYDHSPSRSMAASGIPVPRTHEEEEAELQRAINASLKESRQHLSRGMDDAASAATAPVKSSAAPEVDLFDFGPPTAPAPPPSDSYSVMSYTSAPPQGAFYSNAPPPQYGVPNQNPPTSYLALPPAESAYSAPPQTNSSSYAPSSYAVPPASSYAAPSSSYAASSYAAPPSSSYAPSSYAPPPSSYGDFGPTMNDIDDPFAPKPPTHNAIANEILKSYAAPSPTGSLVNPGFETPMAAGGYYAPPQTPTYSNGGGGGYTPQPASALSMNGLAVTEEPEYLSELEKAMRKLVNIDHIDEPAEEQIKLTMRQKETVQAAKNKNKSKPLPPAALRMVGSAATLGQISEVKPKTVPNEGIMRAPPPQFWHPDAAAAGMLVVHGLNNSNGGGPPPLQLRGYVHGQQPYHHHQQQPGQMYMSPPPPPQQQQQSYPPQQQGYQPQQQYYR